MAPSDDWCHQSIVSVSWADWQQERVVPDTAAHFRVKLCTSAQRPCNQSAPGCTASEGRQKLWLLPQFWSCAVIFGHQRDLRHDHENQHTLCNFSILNFEWSLMYTRRTVLGSVRRTEAITVTPN